ncbi:hypothetical protein BT93_H2167 [Corymbia citriodora subsp. variegata]|nr:hypothetical protein BT93_H2167 [Corymbia citriodora subsp. variegata]
MMLKMDLCPCFGSKKGKKPKRQEDKYFSKDSKVSGNARADALQESRLESSVSEEGCKGTYEAQIFSYRELATATKDFRDEVLGQGGFGSVYKGQLKKTGQVVAVKQLNKAGRQGDHEFLVEVLMLSLLRHPNLVSLIGYCAEGDQRLVVYEYLHLKSLEDLLQDPPPDREPLDWNTRMMITAGVARGLNYLHNEADPPVIHRDMKSSNILLDEKYHPKLSDFGLAKFGPTGDKTHVSTRVLGTQGYCAPEYGLSGKLTKKSDIYSFGVVLLEIVTGRRALEYVDGHAKYIVEWTRPILKDRKNCIQLADPRLEGQFPESILRKVLDMAAMCIREEPSKRPPIDEVVLALDYLASQKYHPPTSTKVSTKKGHRDKSPDEMTTMLDKELELELEREQAIAEAKMWGESWRDKRRQNSLSTTDVKTR